VDSAVKTEPEPQQPERRRMSPSMWGAAGLGVALLVGAVVTGIALNGSGDTTTNTDATGPVVLVPVDAPQAGSATCTKLLDSLPQQLPNGGSTLTRRALAKPAPQAAAAWGSADDPVVLRCGVEQPPEFTATSELLQVDNVNWLQVNGDDATTWYAVDRAATIALTVPGGSGTGPLQTITATISKTLPAVPPHPAG
jgi:hypothetical protein